MFHSTSILAVILSLPLLSGGAPQRVYLSPGINKDQIICPAPLLKVLPKSMAMLESVRRKANKEGLLGWPESPHVTNYEVFGNPLYDRIWSPHVALWNVSRDKRRFSAILLMRELHSQPKPFSSDLEYLEAVYVSDAFGRVSVKRLGVKIHALYRNPFSTSSPVGFPKSIELGDFWSFQDIHDEGGASTHFVFTPSIGLARTSIVLETRKEHEIALNTPEEQEEMGDSGGHSDECAGVFIEDFTIVQESDGYLWLEANGSLYAFNIGSVSQAHRSMLKPKSKQRSHPAP